jgi:hypothetical protein
LPTRAAQCVEEGGWLPSAAQLIGAAPRAKLQSTIDDNPVTSGAEEFPDPKYGIKDHREMSGDLFTVSAGSSAAEKFRCAFAKGFQAKSSTSEAVKR